MTDWSEVVDEIRATNYPHPTITQGQHNNGPGEVWVRIADTWYATGEHALHRVRAILAAEGRGRIDNGQWRA